MQRLRKLRSLPLPTASKAAVIRSAVHTMVPYGIYAIPPKALPTHHLQVLTNQVLKGGPQHQHMTNALMQHPKIGEDAPNIENDMAFLAIAELHRILNTPNFTQQVLKQYLKIVQMDMQWPHHPLDPATMHLKLHPHWDDSLVDIWRQWLSQTPQAVRPSFVSTQNIVNPGGWTNFFSSKKFDYTTTKINRHPWMLPENLRNTLASQGVYNYTQFSAIPKQQWYDYLTITEMTQVRLHITNQTFRCHMLTRPPLRNPWEEPKIKPMGPWPANTLTAGDGAATDFFMSAAWAAATQAQFRPKAAKGIPANQQAAQPVYGYLNSTWSETYALEGSIITALHTGIRSTEVFQATEEATTPPPGHAQDNQSVLETYQKYMSAQNVHPGHFVTTQQARPAWRRILAAKAHLTEFTVGWKKGHANNWDINAVDHLTKPELHHLPLEEAETLFPDLQVIIEGMDEFSLVLTFPTQPNLPIAHPCLPTPGHTRKLRTTTSVKDPPSPWVTMRHDGTRNQLHTLWRHLLANHGGHMAPTYQFMTQNINMKMAQEGLLLRQKGYWTTMKIPPRLEEQTPPIDSPITGAVRTLILHLRQGLWVVHTRTQEMPPIPAFRCCNHCHQMATLHHVLCVCTEPAMIQHRQHLLEFGKHLKLKHPYLPNGTTCSKEASYHAATPTNLANTRFALNTQPAPKPQTLVSPACLHAWLGLHKGQAPKGAKYHRLHIATMHTTARLIHQWMQLVQEKGEMIRVTTECNTPQPAKQFLPLAPRPPPPVLVQKTTAPTKRTRTRPQCQHAHCSFMASPHSTKCSRHQAEGERRNIRRLTNPIYNARRRVTSAWTRATHTIRTPVQPAPTSFILVSGAFGSLTEEDTQSTSQPATQSAGYSETPVVIGRRDPLPNHAETTRGREHTPSHMAEDLPPGMVASKEPRNEHTAEQAQRSPRRKGTKRTPSRDTSDEEDLTLRRRLPSQPSPTTQTRISGTVQAKRLRSPTQHDVDAWNQRYPRRRHSRTPPPNVQQLHQLDTVEYTALPTSFGTHDISGPTNARLIATRALLTFNATPLRPPSARNPKRNSEHMEHSLHRDSNNQHGMKRHKTPSLKTNTNPNQPGEGRTRGWLDEHNIPPTNTTPATPEPLHAAASVEHTNTGINPRGRTERGESAPLTSVWHPLQGGLATGM
jgi:hypothetical protein